MSQYDRTPERLVLIGCKGFAGINAVAWTDLVVPNIPDYDTVIVSVPHVTEDFLKKLDPEFFDTIKKALVLFLHSGGKLVILLSPAVRVNRPNRYPDQISNLDWCPLSFFIGEEAGQSIVRKSNKYEIYLRKMNKWSFYLKIPNDCLTPELTDFYGLPHQTSYKVPFDSYLETRYSRALAGQCLIEVKIAREKQRGYGSAYTEYPEKPDHVTGPIVFLPLIDGISPEEALLDILKEDVGYSLRSPAPDWAQEIEIPSVSDLRDQITSANAAIDEQKKNIAALIEKVDDLTSYRRLLYSSGVELENVVQSSFELLGATVLPAKYGQEEYILKVGDDEFLVEVKGVSKSISLSNLRQLMDYMMKYEEDTGRKGKGVLLGNAWRNLPPAMRNAEDTPVFPDNVIKRAEELRISGLLQSEWVKNGK